jgi:hypothetical protein
LFVVSLIVVLACLTACAKTPVAMKPCKSTSCNRSTSATEAPVKETRAASPGLQMESAQVLHYSFVEADYEASLEQMKMAPNQS